MSKRICCSSVCLSVCHDPVCSVHAIDHRALLTVHVFLFPSLATSMVTYTAHTYFWPISIDAVLTGVGGDHCPKLPFPPLIHRRLLSLSMISSPFVPLSQLLHAALISFLHAVTSLFIIKLDVIVIALDSARRDTVFHSRLLEKFAQLNVPLPIC